MNCTKVVTTASGTVAIPQYIIDHNCNTTASAIDLQEAKLSFPSGHSSYSTYAFMFLFVNITDKDFFHNNKLFVFYTRFILKHVLYVQMLNL